MLVTLLALSAMAKNFTYEGLVYTVLDETAKTCQTKSNNSTNIEGAINIPSSVSDGSSMYTVVKIGDASFRGCDKLTSVSIPESVSDIGEYAFSECTSMISVSIPESTVTIGKYAFNGCTALTSAVIPAYEIGPHAFEKCTDLRSVTITESVNIIRESAFENCSELTEIILPNSVTELGSSVFCHCTKLAKVKLPESLAQIRLLSFYECSSLKEISLPESITNIGLQAFYGCPLTKIYSYNPVPPASGAFQLDPDAECTVIVPAGSGPAYLRLSAWAGLYNLEEADLAGNGSAAFTEWLAYTVNDDHTCSVRKALDVVPGVLTIPPSTTQGGETYTVTAIGSSAFSSCSELKEIEIPETVRDISEYAFSYCYSLKKVTIPNIQNIGRYAFSYCRNLQQMTISGSIQTIGESAFSYCGTIKSVTIEAGENPVHIGDCVFRDSKIESLTIKKPWTFNVDKQSYPRNACFKNASAIKTVNVSEIPDYAFADCRLESVTLIDSPTKIGDHAFSGSYLKSLTLPESIVSIGTEAFHSCDFSSLTIPESVIMIGDYAFDNCKIGSLTIAMRTISSRAFSTKGSSSPCSISSLSLTDNVNTIGAYAFESITGLSELVIPETVTRIREYAFKDSEIESVKIASNEIGDGAFSGCYNMTSVSMSNAVTKIGNLVFNNCGHLTSVTLPESITEIPSATFEYCNKLPSITIPESVTKIGKEAFRGCTSLQTITIPESVSAIGESAFYDCISMSSVSIPESVSGTHYNTFIGCSGLTTVYIKSASSDRENKARADETTPAEIFGGAALWLDCDNIREVYYDCEHPLEGSESLFSDDVYPNATLYVKESARLEAISTTPWGKFLKIKAHDFAGIENIADDNGISGPTEVYNLNGLKVGNSTDGLPAGLYIVSQGGTTTKTIVK